MNKLLKLVNKLDQTHQLSLNEYEFLISNRSPELQKILANLATQRTHEIFQNKIYIRGLIEISNICKNNCFYCGIRRDNQNCERYHLQLNTIETCIHQGYELGFRTFVLQGGENNFYTDELLSTLIQKIKKDYPDCAITLSLGERSKKSYQTLFSAGADRYLLRHETADPIHYKKLHPSKMSYKHRIQCLKNLHQIGYQTGCGFMVGSPYQMNYQLAADLKFIEIFSPEMCGIGPFIPHIDTPFSSYPPGSASLCCFLLSILRIMKPNLLLPATTALNTILPNGRKLGILSGANVIMPNLSPVEVREKYTLYNNKLHSGQEAAENLEVIKKELNHIGYKIVIDRGDFKSI